jgi:uncharacterized membrane protein YeaQ/YmgE (transglycosylase-associated protein family)
MFGGPANRAASRNNGPNQTIALKGIRSILIPQQTRCARQPGKSNTEVERMMHLLWTALIGLIVGAIAKFIMPGKDPGGIFITMLIGIAGSFLGTWLGRMIGHYEPDQSAGFLMSLVGALILLGIYHLYKRSRA